MRIFISGGCKNGKSTYAQRAAKYQSDAGNAPLYYIATMRAYDGEDAARIKRHREEREGWGFITVEQPEAIEGILNKCDVNGSFLLDSLTALLANEMFKAPATVTDAGDAGNAKDADAEDAAAWYDASARERISGGLSLILERVRNIVIVSDYIYSDAILYDPLTEEYRKSLAALDRLAAARCDAALEAAYSNLIIHKGGAGLEKTFFTDHIGGIRCGA